MIDPTLTDASQQIEATLNAAELFVDAVPGDGGIELVGIVDSDENRQAAIDLAEQIAGPLGIAISDGMEIESALPDDLFGDEAEGGSATDEYDRAHEPDEDRIIELEPDFAGDPGTTDAMLAVEEGAAYFAPTDPVVAPIDGPEELAVIGGFEETALDDLAEVSGGAEDDEAVASRICEALRRDALTSDLAGVGVSVRGDRVVLYGEVPSTEDAENAEAVAAEAAGGRNVEERLKIEPGVR